MSYLVMRLHSTQCGHVNRHNCRIWAEDQPNLMQEWERDTPKVNVWLGLPRSTVYGSFMLAEKTVTGNVYLDMLEQFLEPQLISDGITDTIVFQQDGAPPHLAITVRDYLNQAFPSRWIGRAAPMMWPTRSPDLIPLDFFALGFIKSDVYQVKINSIQQLKQRIRATAPKITPAKLGKVFRSVVERWSLCLDVQGGHIEIHWKYVLLCHMFQYYYIMCNNTCLNTKCIVTFESPCIM